MCLSKADLQATKKLRSSKKQIVCWKVVRSNNLSLYFNFNWKLQKTNISNRSQTRWTENEKNCLRIERGFHAFLTRKDARVEKKYFVRGCKIIRCVGQPKDVVAVGYWAINTREKNNVIVFTKLYADKIVS
jgi:hypothetical protein